MTWVAVAIFVFSYGLITSRRLRLLPIGRPAGALLGATLMVAFGVLSPQESYEAIDHNTILLLFAMMLLTGYLEMSGVFSKLSLLIERLGRNPGGMLTLACVVSGFLSAFLVNDTICLVLTPIVVSICVRKKLPIGPYLIGIATSANIGSAATLVGNPQNMIIGSLSGFGFTQFLMKAGPAALVGLVLNIGLLHVFYARKLPSQFPGETDESEPDGPFNGSKLPALVAVLVGMGFVFGFHLGYTALAGAVAVMIIERKEPVEVMRRVDWSLLLFFVSLFIVIHGLASTGLVDLAWEAAIPYLQLHEAPGIAFFNLFMAAGSNLVSNVPMVMLTGPAIPDLGASERGWLMLAFSTTVAGNLTLLGSVANIIVAEQARDHYSLGFWEYLKFGAVSTGLVLAAGTIMIAILT